MNTMNTMNNFNLQKGFASLFLLLVVVAAAVGGGAWYYARKQKIIPDSLIVPQTTPRLSLSTEKEMMENKELGPIMTKKPSSPSPTSGDEPGTIGPRWSGTVLAGSQSPLLDFNSSDYKAALDSEKLIVLYFYANWCPVCKLEIPKFYDAFNELTSDQVIGFRVNYNDNETTNEEEDLARQYGVAYQHTKVFIRNGQRIGKWPDSWDKTRYLSEIEKRF